MEHLIESNSVQSDMEFASPLLSQPAAGDPSDHPYAACLTMDAIDARMAFFRDQGEVVRVDTDDDGYVRVFGNLVLYDPCADECCVDFDHLFGMAAKLAIDPHQLLRDLVWFANERLALKETAEFHRTCARWIAGDDTALSVFRAYRAVETQDRVDLREWYRNNPSPAGTARVIR